MRENNHVFRDNEQIKRLYYLAKIMSSCILSRPRILHACADPEEGGTRTPPPPEKSKTIGCLSDSSPDLLRNYEATEPAFNVVPSSARQRNAI